MRPAVPILKSAIKDIELHDPRIPVYSNVDGKPLTKAGQVARAVPKQVTSPVKWQQCMLNMFDYEHPGLMPTAYECGPGKGSLSAILKAVNGKAGREAKYVQV